MAKIKTDGPRWKPAAVVLIMAIVVWFFSSLSTYPAVAQAQPLQRTPTPGSGSEPPLQAPDTVEIEPTARDEEIRERLLNILEATGWFVNPEVEVREGVVFLRGQAGMEEHKTWAGDLARNTQDVVAVVNQINLITPSIWNFQPALNTLREMWTGLVRSLPLIGISLVILLITVGLTRFGIRAARVSFRRRFNNPLLTSVASYSVGFLVFLTGLYIVLRVSGLTTVAATVLGGTGLLGLVLGIAFRDITENFLASIFLSVQNPFRTGDLVEVAGLIGFVQALTTRATVMMTLDGNQVQIPNATVYKSNIVNFSSNPNHRADFIIGVGYADQISHAQEVALKVLEDHPAVLADPEPMVLVDNLSSATVNLRIYFWVDGTEHSLVKVKSSVIRLVKRAFQEASISMPDEARELVFPEGVPLRWTGSGDASQSPMLPARPSASSPLAEESPQVETTAEGGLRSEAGAIQAQAEQAWKPEEGANLLQPSDEDADDPLDG